MMTAESPQLLADYVATGSERAFQELVARYVDLVYSVALRLVDGDAHRAQDVAQTVFIDLARLAPKLSPNPLLGGWLHRHTCFVARTLMRGERRRQARERQAVEMSALDNHPDAALAEAAAVLDEAIHELGPDDRDAILLRFFECRNLRAVGEGLGINENVAQKRVARALQELATLLRRRGVTLSAAALATALSAGAVNAAPAGLAVALAKGALAGTGATAGTAGSAAKLALVSKLKVAFATAIIAAGLGTMTWLQFPSRAKQHDAPQLAESPPAESQATAQPEPSTPAPDPPPPPQEPASAQTSPPSPAPPPVAPAELAPVAPASPPAAVLPAAAFPPGDFLRRFVARVGSKVTINGTANLIHPKWRVQSDLISGELEVGPGFPAEPGQAATPSPIVAKADVFIPVTALKSVGEDGSHYSDAMDNAMYEKLKAAQYRRIHFHLTELVLKEAAQTVDQPYLCEATGALAVAGVTNQVTLPVQVLPLNRQRLKISGTTMVKMTDFQIDPPQPKFALGRLVTGDAVQLSFDWVVALTDQRPTASLDDLVPLALALPAPGFRGTSPGFLGNPWVEPVSATPRPPLLVPPGLPNLARAARINSSDKNATPATLAKIIDGNKNANAAVYLRKGPQWVQLDLRGPCEIYAIVLWHAHDAPKVYHHVVIQLADDPDCKQAVQTLFNNDRTNDLGLGAGTDREYVESYEGKLIDTQGATGQCLRFYSKGSTQSALNEYTEIEVYGRRVP